MTRQRHVFMVILATSSHCGRRKTNQYMYVRISAYSYELNHRRTAVPTVSKKTSQYCPDRNSNPYDDLLSVYNNISAKGIVFQLSTILFGKKTQLILALNLILTQCRRPFEHNVHVAPCQSALTICFINSLSFLVILHCCAE